MTFSTNWVHLINSVFLNNKNKGLVVVRVQVGHLHARLLLLSDPLPLRVQELDLDVGIRGAGDVHLLEFLALQDTDGELKHFIIRFVSPREKKIRFEIIEGILLWAAD